MSKKQLHTLSVGSTVEYTSTLAELKYLTNSNAQTITLSGNMLFQQFQIYEQGRGMDKAKNEYDNLVAPQISF